MSPQQYEALLRPIWEYLLAEQDPLQADVIFVFGGLDLAVPRRAAELFASGLSSQILVSGRSGPLTVDRFDRPEALVFRDEMVKNGVPAEAILTEESASNTLENVRLGLKVLSDAGIHPRSALLVAKPFLMRRCVATFEKQAPTVTVRACPPRGPILGFVDRSRKEFGERLLAELGRLERYGAAGDVALQAVPSTVGDARLQLKTFLAAT